MYTNISRQIQGHQEPKKRAGTKTSSATKNMNRMSRIFVQNQEVQVASGQVYDDFQTLHHHFEGHLKYHQMQIAIHHLMTVHQILRRFLQTIIVLKDAQGIKGKNNIGDKLSLLKNPLAYTNKRKGMNWKSKHSGQ